MIDTIYRVTLPSREVMHTAFRPLAEVWAKRQGSKLEEVMLTIPPELRTVAHMNPWRLAVDTALVDSGLDCTTDKDDPAARVRELLEWTETVALDPAVSPKAQALLRTHGVTEAHHQTFCAGASEQKD